MQNGRGEERETRGPYEGHNGKAILGDLWNPRRYEPTIAIHMDKLIQDGVLYIDDGTTIRNEMPRFENVNLIWIAGKLSQCLFYECDDLSAPIFSHSVSSFVYPYAYITQILPRFHFRRSQIWICPIVRGTALCRRIKKGSTAHQIQLWTRAH